MNHLHSISARIASIALVALLFIAGGGAFSYFNLRANLLAQKELELKDEVKTATTLIDGLRNRVKTGEIAEADAKARALAALRPMRFGEGGNYFFVYGKDGAVLMLPPVPQAEGTNRFDFKDPDGRLFVRDFITNAQAGGGLTTYRWLKPGETTPSLKLSYTALSPEWDWVVGTGFHIDDLEALLARSSRDIMLALGAALIAVAGLSALVQRSISRPLASLTAAMERLRRGELDAAIDGADRRDEIGQIARAVSEFRNLLLERQAREAAAEQDRRAEASRVRHEMLDRLAGEFEAGVGGAAGAIDARASGFELVARDLHALSGATSGHAAANATASRAVEENIQSASAAAEQLSASIREILLQVSNAADFANLAVTESAKAAGTMLELSESSNQVGEVVALIETIANKTNLLALNATIEAARAGEAGKGFGVVALEVKSLADSTKKAIEDISGKIAAIQRGARASMASSRTVEETIGRIDNSAATIAATLDQQSAAVDQIAEAITGTLKLVRELTRSMDVLQGHAAAADGKSEEVAESARDMRGRAAELHDQLAQVSKALRAG